MFHELKYSITRFHETLWFSVDSFHGPQLQHPGPVIPAHIKWAVNTRPGWSNEKIWKLVICTKVHDLMDEVHAMEQQIIRQCIYWPMR